jgi:hypothetical protein
MSLVKLIYYFEYNLFTNFISTFQIYHLLKEKKITWRKAYVIKLRKSKRQTARNVELAKNIFLSLERITILKSLCN